MAQDKKASSQKKLYNTGHQNATYATANKMRDSIPADVVSRPMPVDSSVRPGDTTWTTEYMKRHPEKKPK
jgi:hypothetical protein